MYFVFISAKSATARAGETQGATEGSDAALTRVLSDGPRPPATPLESYDGKDV